MARVRIIKKPTAKTGLEVRMQPGLYGTNGNRQFSLPTQIDSQKYSEPDTEVRNTLQPVPRDIANLEAEKGETAVINIDGFPAHFNIGGKRHSQGGTPLNLPDDSFIFSDTAKMKIKDPEILKQFGMSMKSGGYTPADIAKKYQINKFRKMLADPETDDLQRSTAEMMIANYNEKLAKLALAQESKKGFPQGLPAIAMPYIQAHNIDPAQYIPTQGQEFDPNADMGVARYGANVVSSWQFGGPPSFEEFKFKATHPGEEYVSKKPYTAPKKSKEEELRKDLDASERRILGIIKDFRSKGMDLPAGVADAYNKIDAAKKKLEPAPKLSASAKATAWYNAEGEKMRPTIAGTQQWQSYSGENDPSTSYWDRVKGANLFRRDPTHSWFQKETDVVDPRMQEALEKVVPFYGKESEGFGDWGRTLFMMPQYEMNNLLTGYYENPYTTYLRYNKAPESWVARTAMKYATDPMIVDAPYKLLQKGFAKAPPYVGKLASKYGTQLATWIADKAIPGVIKLYGKLTPQIAEKILSTTQKFGQAAIHEGEDTPEMFGTPPATPAPKGSPYAPEILEAWGLLPKKDSVLVSKPKTKAAEKPAAQEEDWEQYLEK